jgi:four helix bundle protein
MVTHFRDLKCWQKALELSTTIYILTENLKDFEIRNQIRRASVSVMNNLAEGFGRRHDKEIIRFFEYSTSSCLEIESMTYLLENLKIFEKSKIDLIRNTVIEIYKMTASLSVTIKKRYHHVK